MSDRSRLIIDPKVQWSITIRIFLHWVAFLAGLVLIGAMFRILGMPTGTSWRDAWHSALRDQVPTCVVMLLLLPVFLRDTIRLTHRFAGPMYRLRVGLASLASDDRSERIVLRTGDFWKVAADDFNIVLEKLQKLEDENTELRREAASSVESVEV